MKKIHVWLCLVLIASSLQTAYGFVETRLHWWEVRLKKLDVQKSQIQKNRDLDQRISGIIDREIGRARAILAMKKSVSESISSGSKIRNAFAQQEIDAIRSYAEDCISLHGKLRYAEDVLARYAAKFSSCMIDARAGRTSQFLDQAISAGSLFRGIENFDSSRMIGEYVTKKYLFNEVKTALARLVTLKRFYKRNRIGVARVPSQEDIAVMDTRLKNRVQFRIDAWTMNESNFSEIDKKAVKRLSLLAPKKLIEPVTNKDSAVQASVANEAAICIRETLVSLELPHGWEEEAVGAIDSYRGVIRSFHSADNVAFIQMVKIPLESKDIESVSEVWVRKSGGIPIEKKHGIINDVPYVWICARDKERNVIETCSLSRDGYALLINGRASRSRGMMFKAQFSKIISSIRPGEDQ